MFIGDAMQHLSNISVTKMGNFRKFMELISLIVNLYSEISWKFILAHSACLLVEKRSDRVYSINFFRPGKVMEIYSRFWKIHKKSWKLKGIFSQNGVFSFLSSRISIQGYVYVIRSNFVIFHIFCTVTGILWVVHKGKTSGSLWPRLELVASVHVSFMPQSM